MSSRIATILLLAFAILPVGCGYSTRGLYPESIETVSIPLFKNRGLRRDIEILLTEKVAKAVEAQTPFKVVQSGGDTELIGSIDSYFKLPYGEDGFDNPRGGMMTMNLSVSWIDRRTGRVINESTQTFTISDTTNYVIDLGQSQATANEKLCDDMAGYVVSLMQTPW